MIEVRQLSKLFGAVVAVNDLSFRVGPGEILGFLGPNGAGKSTTMKMITGFLASDSGEILVNGKNIEQFPLEAKRAIGYLPEGAPAYGDMTVIEFLRFIADVRGLERDRTISAIARVSHQVGLGDVLHKTITTLSKGFKRRVGLAQALLHDPDILILDEPTDGLDPNQKHQVRELIRNLAQNKLVVVSTHILEEVSAVCTRALIIRDGRKVFDGTPAELSARSSYHNAVAINLTQDADDLPARLMALGDIERVEVENSRHLVLFAKSGKDIFGKVKQFADEHKLPLSALYLEPGRLEDVFRKLTMEG